MSGDCLNSPVTQSFMEITKEKNPTIEDPQRNSNGNETQGSNQATLETEQTEEVTISGNSQEKKITSGIQRQNLEKQKLSGAQRRKLKKQRQLEVKTGDAEVRENTSTKQVATKNGTSKRPISEDSKPSPKGKPAKKPKDPINPSSYRDITSAIKVMIVPVKYPECKLTTEQANVIENDILGEIDKIIPGEANPQFEESRFLGSYLRVTCSNKSTKEWLESLFEDSTKYKVMEVKEPIKVFVWIPGSPQLEVQTIIKRLEIQNQGLNPREWRLISRRIETKGQKLVFGIDETSAKKLAELDYKPHLNLTRVSFNILGKKGKEANIEESTGVDLENPKPDISSKP